MHTQTLGKEVLYSFPIEVEFAGFLSDTLKLAHAGWELSMRQARHMWGGYDMQLALRHAGAQLYALSSPVQLEYRDFGALVKDMPLFAQYLKSLCFRIMHVAPEIQFKIQPVQNTMSSPFLDQWAAIDPRPQERESVSMKDFKFFKVANPSIKDIVVEPSQVSELLELVLKAQKPMVDQVRARERSRENMQAYREMGSTKPAHHVQAQIITLAS